MKLLKAIKEYFWAPEKMSLAELYLSYAVSLEDVERRLRQIDRGDAPFQKQRGE